MKPAIAKAIIEASDTIGLSLELRKNYGGRGMYGGVTHAVVGKHSEFYQAIAYAAGTIQEPNEDESLDEVFDLDQFCDEMGSLRSDNMGYDTVWY